ncbi:MAG: hypothetical protein MUO64_16580 [Anaerolineales bacterium]|nr:hypothetical protein [Anaerolineales bacterium]
MWLAESNQNKSQVADHLYHFILIQYLVFITLLRQKALTVGGKGLVNSLAGYGHFCARWQISQPNELAAHDKRGILQGVGCFIT